MVETESETTPNNDHCKINRKYWDRKEWKFSSIHKKKKKNKSKTERDGIEITWNGDTEIHSSPEERRVLNQAAI